MTSTRRPAGLLAITAALLLIPAASAAARPGHDRDQRPRAGPLGEAHHVVRGSADTDGDGINNRYEFLAGTDPRKADSDRDGTPDGAEDRDGDRVTTTRAAGPHEPGPQGLEPQPHAGRRRGPRPDAPAQRGRVAAPRTRRDPDSDDDGVQDGDEHAGVISAVDGARLTIQLAAGGSLTAAVDDETLIACDDGSADDGSGDDPSFDDEGDDLDEDADVDVEVLDDDDFDDDGAADDRAATTAT